ncbi:MAG: hypothetical protein LLG15_06060 [Betaproteobacteria bacterium]|nr:hypothetical protein [Betaproteobacteria bacterium]
MKILFFMGSLAILFASNTWAAITIGDFTLGAPKNEVLVMLKSRFQSIKETQGSRYQIERPLVSATLPIHPYLLGNVPISEVNIFFNNDDLLNQVEIKLNTTHIEEVRKHIPQVEKSTLDPDFGDTWEVIVGDGEIIYYVSKLFGSAEISFADKATSKENITARRLSNQRFKKLNGKIDKLIEIFKKNESEVHSTLPP